jgi:phosphoglucosamine mutase
MIKKYFGTDGIRGKANQHPMTADVALRVAMATAKVLRTLNQSTLDHSRNNNSMNRVVIGKDTRRSCYMLEQAMTAGFLSCGMDVILTGPIPTPAVAILTRSLRADCGVMISASHNPHDDNGIKLFANDGYKLPDDVELQIEHWMDHPELMHGMPSSESMGRASRLDDATGRYIEYVKASVPKGQTLSGLKIILDCANGAAYKAAPQALWELEADVTVIGNQPNGVNINLECGATNIAALQARVLSDKADIGIALDGDADRVIIVDELGQKIDGDQLLASLALSLKSSHALVANTIVATVMSNLGFERFCATNGMELIRAAVGDRYVVEQMKSGGYSLGGEQSGHIVMSNFGTTGDGLLAAIQILSLVKESGKRASEALKQFNPVPQILKNIRYQAGKNPMGLQAVNDAIKQAEIRLDKQGRLLVRASGTEPLVRIMAEGDDAKLIEKIVDDLANIISGELK